MSDRLIAERMGWTPCLNDDGELWHKPGAACSGIAWGHRSKLPTMADARDREAVIAWLNAQGMAVMTTECAAAYVISIHETEPDGTPKIEAVCMARGIASQKAEAFRAAVLAATEGKEQ